MSVPDSRQKAEDHYYAALDLMAGRFDACLTQAQSFSPATASAYLVVVRDTFQLACAWGAGGAEGAGGALGSSVSSSVSLAGFCTTKTYSRRSKSMIG